MSMALELLERPTAKEIYMLAGWRQWADAGSVSSGLPQYLVETLGARKIGHIKPNGFYLFQTQVSQFLFRPQVRFENGYRTSIRKPTNEVYYWANEDDSKGLIIFLGDEPHMNVDEYVEAFFSIAQQLKVKRVVSVGGIYASVPFDKDRHFSCSYSLLGMKDELSEYVVNFSNYEGGVSLGSYMNDRAEGLNIEYFTLYAFVPMYDFSQLAQKSQNMSIENDYRAWHEVLLRLNHMFGLRLDLTELSRDSSRLTEQLHEHVAELSRQHPSFPINDYMTRIAENFEERSFTKLDDVWEDALRDFDEE